MGFFSSLFKKKPAIELQDPVFGLITFEQGGWWTSVPKEPNSGFVITIRAPKTGPSEEQRAFFNRIRSDLVELERRAREFILSKPEPVPQFYTESELRVVISHSSTYCITIYDTDATRREEFQLELVDAEPLPINRTSFLVDFRSGQPIDYSFDAWSQVHG